MWCLLNSPSGVLGWEERRGGDDCRGNVSKFLGASGCKNRHPECGAANRSGTPSADGRWLPSAPCVRPVTEPLGWPIRDKSTAKRWSVRHACDWWGCAGFEDFAAAACLLAVSRFADCTVRDLAADGAETGFRMMAVEVDATACSCVFGNGGDGGSGGIRNGPAAAAGGAGAGWLDVRLVDTSAGGRHHFGSLLCSSDLMKWTPD